MKTDKHSDYSGIFEDSLKYALSVAPSSDDWNRTEFLHQIIDFCKHPDLTDEQKVLSIWMLTEDYQERLVNKEAKDKNNELRNSIR